MVKKKGLIFVPLLCVGLLLGGCSNSNQSKSNKHVQSTKVSSSKKVDSAQKSSQKNTTKSSVDTKAKSTTEAFIPANLQKTWYSVDEDGNVDKLSFTANAIHYENSVDSGTTTIHDGSSEPDPDTASIHSDWGRSGKVSIHGINFLNVLGWNQSAGDGTYFGIKSEVINGKPTDILVDAEGAGVWCSATYYESEALAHQEAGKKYSDIVYSE
jgi:hypothetical protein